MPPKEQPHDVTPAPAAAVQAAFPKGNLYVDLRTEFGTLYSDELFADLYPAQGRPVEVAPWRLALVLVIQYLEGLTDRQAADAVRRCLDWKYALSLELTDPGFDFTLLHDFRERLLSQNAAPRLLDTLLAACQARCLLTSRGTQRTDSTHVLAAVRTLHRLECVLETLRLVLNRLAVVAPDWLQARVPDEWYARYATRAEHFRLPKEMSKRRALAETAGQFMMVGVLSRAKDLFVVRVGATGIGREILRLRAQNDKGALGASSVAHSLWSTIQDDNVRAADHSTEHIHC